MAKADPKRKKSLWDIKVFTVLRFYAFMNFCILCINCSLHGNESVKSMHEQSVDNIRDVYYSNSR